MRPNWFPRFLAGVASLVLVSPADAGGQVIVTVRDVPVYAVAGRPLRFTFVIRDIAGKPTVSDAPAIAAVFEGDTVRAPAVTTGNTGEYAATLILPRPGNWTIRFNAFDDSSERESSTISGLAVIASGSPEPPPLSQSALGQRLFEAKDCTHCHNVLDQRYGPYPIRKQFDEAYLQSYLSRQGETRGIDLDTYIATMPDLELTPSEIEALTAYLL